MCGFLIKAITILTALKDPIIHLYAVFLTPAVSELEQVYSLFQSDTIDAEEMTEELQMHSEEIKSTINMDNKRQCHCAALEHTLYRICKNPTKNSP